MAVYFETEGFKLCHSNCFNVLPLIKTGTVDAVITDPPYSSGGFTRSDKADDPRVKYCKSGRDLGRVSFVGDNRDQRSFAWWSVLWVTECHRVLVEGGYCLIFADWRQLPLMTDVLQAGHFVWRGLIAWDKGLGSRAPHKGYFRHQCEYIPWATKGPCFKATHGGPWAGCLKYPVKQSDKHHMTGKPTPLLCDLVQCVPPGALVCDPFAGSGTSAVACAMTGRSWVGCEIDERNCEITARRIEQAIREGARPAAA